MAPTSALWEHPSESATSVSAALNKNKHKHKPAGRGSDGETPWKRRSARIAAIRKRTGEASSRRPRPQGKPRSATSCAPPPPAAPPALPQHQLHQQQLHQLQRPQHQPQQHQLQQPQHQPQQHQLQQPQHQPQQHQQPQQHELQQPRSPQPADTATAAEAAAQQRSRSRHASLAHVLWRTLLLMHSNRLLALQVEALKRETSAFVCSVLSNPENRALAPPQQQPASS